MYQFTHEWFMDFFRGLVKKFRWKEYEKTNKSKEKGMNKLRKKMTKALFNVVTQSLFQRDILLFSFLLAYQELDSELKCDIRQVEFFIKGSLATENEILSSLRQKDPKKSKPFVAQTQAAILARAENRKRVAPWLSAKQWVTIDKLSAIPPFN